MFGRTVPELEAALDDSPAEVIALNVWVLTVAARGTSAGGPLENEPIAELLSRAKTAPINLGTIDHVRDWISKLTIAGVLERSSV
jgi:hypothetical protein